MEKISRIIPSSPRTRAVEVSGQPARPGAPAWGRPVGRTTPRNFFDQASESSVANRAAAAVELDPASSQVDDRVSFSSTPTSGESASETSDNSALYNAKGARPKAQLVEELSKRFFEGAAKPTPKEDVETIPQAEKIAPEL